MTQLVGSSATATGSADSVGTGAAEAAQFTATVSGTIDTISFFNTTAAAGVTSLDLGIFTDSASLPSALIGRGARAGSLPLNTLVSVTGLSIAVVAGTVYWLALLPVGAGQANWKDTTTGAGGTLLAGSSSTTMTTLASSPGTWTPVSGFGPFEIFATGTASGGLTDVDLIMAPFQIT